MVHFKVCTVKCVLSYDHDELLFKKKKMAHMHTKHTISVSTLKKHG